MSLKREPSETTQSRQVNVILNFNLLSRPGPVSAGTFKVFGFCLMSRFHFIVEPSQKKQ
jgi:hypothetical protein